MKYIDEKMKQNIMVGVISGAILLVIFFLLYNLREVSILFSKLMGVMMPFISGFAIAFVMSPLVSVFEKILPKLMKAKTKRFIGISASMLIFAIILTLFMLILIPQLADSVSILANSLGTYFNNIDDITAYLVNTFNLTPNALESLSAILEDLVNFVVVSVTNYLPQIIDGSVSFVIKTFNMVVGIVVAVYILIDRERFYLQAKKIMYALFPKNKVDYVVDVTHLSSHLFKRFIIGKMIDSLIIGIICFIGMSLLGFDFVLLISCIIGVTNMIPVFGPFIGAIPSFLILILVNPVSAFWFLVFVFVLQQFDGNILGPYILGDSMGLPGLWVMFAIIVGGGFFNVIGMFLGVPVFALIYFLVKTAINKRLEEKEVVVE